MPALVVEARAPSSKRRRRATLLHWEWQGYAHTQHTKDGWPWIAVREDGETSSWKLLIGGDRSRVELYDLSNDKGEKANVAGAHTEVVARLRRAALQWQASLPKGKLGNRTTDDG